MRSILSPLQTRRNINSLKTNLEISNVYETNLKIVFLTPKMSTSSKVHQEATRIEKVAEKADYLKTLLWLKVGSKKLLQIIFNGIQQKITVYIHTGLIDHKPDLH